MRWTLAVKLKLAAVLIAVVALFATVGYWATPLDDPRGPIILANMAQPVVSIALLTGMLAATALAGTLLLYRDIPGAPWLMLGAGWTGLAFRSWPIDNRLVLLANDQLAGLYARLLAELGLLGAISGLLGVLTTWLASLLPLPPADDRPADQPDDDDISPADGAMKLTNTWLITMWQAGAVAIVGIIIYAVLVSSQATGGQFTWRILRGQVLFALIGGFGLAAFAVHHVVPTRSPWRLVAGVGLAGVACYVLSIMLPSARQFAYHPPTRLGAMLPVDILGLALAASMAGYLISFRLVQIRRMHARQADQAGKQPAAR